MWEKPNNQRNSKGYLFIYTNLSYHSYAFICKYYHSASSVDDAEIIYDLYALRRSTEHLFQAFNDL